MQARLSASEQATLLSLAHDAICSAIHETPVTPIDLDALSPRLREPQASFVTISLEGNLRGCIGTVEKFYPLAQDVMLRAAAAATQDPRFPPLRPDELEHIDIEISILSDTQPVQYQDPLSLPGLLENGRNGVILRYANKRATFLPQVWARVADGQQFLTLLCRKATLPDDFWKSGQIELETYKVLSFKR